MQPARDAVIAKIAEVIDKTVNTFYDYDIDIKVGFVGYRDVTDRERYKIIPWMDCMDIASFTDQLKDCECTGGGDTPEDVLGGMDQALKQLFDIPNGGVSSLHADPSTRNIPVVFHLGDAPHHGPIFSRCGDSHPDLQDSPRPYTEILDDFAANKIDYYFTQLDGSTADMSRMFKTSFDNNQRRNNNFQVLDFTSLNVDTVFEGFRSGLSRSVMSHMNKAAK